MSWFLLNANVLVDDETIKLNNVGELQLKDGSNVDGVKFLHLNTNLYNSSIANENNKLPLNSAVYKELLNSLSSLLEINNHKLKLVLVNNDNQEIFNKELTIEQSIIQNNTNLIENNAVWKELMDTVNSYYKIESNKLKLKIQNNNADVLLNSELDIDTTATENSTNLINSNAVYKELLNNTNSVFEYDNSDASKDVINLKLQNNNSTDKIDKTIDFNDKLVLKTKTQTLTNKTIDVDDNTLSNIKTDNFKSGVISTRLTTDYYFAWVKDNAYVYTKSANDEANINCYTITITDGEVSAITLLGQGTIASGVLTYNSVEYSRDVNNDGFYVVNEKSKLIAISALTDIMEKAGKVNDIQLNSNSLVVNKVANIIGLTNINNDYYYKWVNGSNVKYTKIRTIGASNVNVYTFTLTDNVLTKITLETTKGSIALHSNGKDLELTWNSTKFILDNDYADSQYYIVGKEKKLLTGQLIESNKDFSKCWENVNFIKMPNPMEWKYVGNLSSDNGSTLNVQDDWIELLLVIRVQEGSNFYNLNNIIPKQSFTVGNPTGNNTFAGFYWNESYNAKLRLGLTGTGANRNLVQNYSNKVGWYISVTYVYKR